jgi:CrcB protein
MTALLVALGAAIGAPLRYLTDRYMLVRFGDGFPWGTLAVNVAGSFVLGLVLGLPLSAGTVALLGTGFCGALTTFSTMQVELLGMLDDGRAGLAAGYAAASIAAGFLAVLVATNLVRRARVLA